MLFKTVLISCVLLSFQSVATVTKAPPFDVSVKRDVPYGTGKIIKKGELTSRDLWMDYYFPKDTNSQNRPTIVYTHGGSFHIGSPRTAYNVDATITTSPEEYCRLFAGLGYNCFAINYRLGVEQPIAKGEGYKKEQVDKQSISLMMDRVDVIRESLGLKKLDSNNEHDLKILTDTVLSAAEDLHLAVRFIKQNSKTFNVDNSKIILGGFSAGAVTSLNVAHAIQEPVAGVFMLSAAPIGLKLYDNPYQKKHRPDTLLFLGQYDLSGALASAGSLVEFFNQQAIDFTFAWVPGMGHFYPKGAPALLNSGKKVAVEEAIVNFVAKVSAK